MISYQNSFGPVEDFVYYQGGGFFYDGVDEWYDPVLAAQYDPAFAQQTTSTSTTSTYTEPTSTYTAPTTTTQTSSGLPAGWSGDPASGIVYGPDGAMYRLLSNGMWSGQMPGAGQEYDWGTEPLQLGEWGWNPWEPAPYTLSAIDQNNTLVTMNDGSSYVVPADMGLTEQFTQAWAGDQDQVLSNLESQRQDWAESDYWTNLTEGAIMQAATAAVLGPLAGDLAGTLTGTSSGTLYGATSGALQGGMTGFATSDGDLESALTGAVTGGVLGGVKGYYTDPFGEPQLSNPDNFGYEVPTNATYPTTIPTGGSSGSTTTTDVGDYGSSGDFGEWGTADTGSTDIFGSSGDFGEVVTEDYGSSGDFGDFGNGDIDINNDVIDTGITNSDGTTNVDLEDIIDQSVSDTGTINMGDEIDDLLGDDYGSSGDFGDYGSGGGDDWGSSGDFGGGDFSDGLTDEQRWAQSWGGLNSDGTINWETFQEQDPFGLGSTAGDTAVPMDWNVSIADIKKGLAILKMLGINPLSAGAKTLLRGLAGGKIDLEGFVRDAISGGTDSTSFPFGDVLSSILEYQGQGEYRDSLFSFLDKALAASDPFASQRGTYQTQLPGVMKDWIDQISGTRNAINTEGNNFKTEYNSFTSGLDKMLQEYRTGFKTEYDSSKTDLENFLKSIQSGYGTEYNKFQDLLKTMTSQYGSEYKGEYDQFKEGYNKEYEDFKKSFGDLFSGYKATSDRMFTDPTYWQNDSVLAGLNRQAASDTARDMSARGYNMSGNEMHAISDKLRDTSGNYVKDFQSNFTNMINTMLSNYGNTGINRLNSYSNTGVNRLNSLSDNRAKIMDIIMRGGLGALNDYSGFNSNLYGTKANSANSFLNNYVNAGANSLNAYNTGRGGALSNYNTNSIGRINGLVNTLQNQGEYAKSIGTMAGANISPTGSSVLNTYGPLIANAGLNQSGAVGAGLTSIEDWIKSIFP